MPREEQIFSNLPRGKLLDLGCGTGRTTVVLSKMGFTAWGIDISEAMISEAKRLHPHLTFLLGDACDLSGFEDGEFDYVLFSFNGLDLIHPYEMRVKCLKESYRVLKDGGLFIYSSHNRSWTSAHPEKNKPIGDGYIENSNPNGPEVVYTTHPNEEAQQLSKVGLQMLRCYTGPIFNYYVAKKSVIRREMQTIKPPSPLLTLPGRAWRKFWRMVIPPVRQTITIDLTKPLESLWDNVKKNRRSEIKRGLMDMVFVFDPPSKDSYLEFEAKNSREMGLFPLPKKWLEEGHLFLAYKHDNGIVAAMLAHIRGKSLVLRRDSSSRDYGEIHAALTWRVIKWAKEQGFKEFDQGGYNEKLHPGVSLWKKEFGGYPAVRRAP